MFPSRPRPSAPLAILGLASVLLLAGCAAEPELSEQVVTIDRDMMPEIPCHEMSGTIMGDCGEPEISAVFEQMGLDPAFTIVYDKQQRPGEPCAAEGLVISGDCSAEDLARLDEEIRAQR